MFGNSYAFLDGQAPEFRAHGTDYRVTRILLNFRWLNPPTNGGGRTTPRESFWRFRPLTVTDVESVPPIKLPVCVYLCLATLCGIRRRQIIIKLTWTEPVNRSRSSYRWRIADPPLNFVFLSIRHNIRCRWFSFGSRTPGKYTTTRGSRTAPILAIQSHFCITYFPLSRGRGLIGE